MELDNQISKLITELYSNLHLSRKTIQFIIDTMINFITNDYNPFLLVQLKKNVFQCISTEVQKKIEYTFEKNDNPFVKYKSEKGRIILYKKLGMFVEPHIVVINENPQAKSFISQTLLTTVEKTIIHFPIKHSLTQILQMKGLFQAILNYIDVLSKEKDLTNFIHGTLWKKQKQNFKESDIVLPLFVYYDDVETGNALGTHSGVNQLGAVYVTCPCFPPSFASKLKSIILAEIFYTRDRKEIGNKIFKTLIGDLNNLTETGLNLKIDNKKFKVNFITSLVLGDNLGQNEILGFVKSFTNTSCCRLCEVQGSQIKKLTREDTSLLRTVEKYENDLKNQRFRSTGVTEECIFNRMHGFNVILNSSMDVMHDVFEGVGNKIIAKILLKLIAEKSIKIEYINARLRSIDFQFESTNVPQSIRLAYVKSNERLKMSASESLFFIRYFGLIVGDSIDEDDMIWPLYRNFREILDIITSSIITEENLLQYNILIKELHTLYLNMFGNLTAKFHNMIHYEGIIRQNGPIIKTSSMRFESRHRDIKTIIQESASKVNILTTIGYRNQLSLMHYMYDEYQDYYVTYGSPIACNFLSIFSFRSYKQINAKSCYY